MNLPKKIDDGLKDAIISVEFISRLPVGTELGVFYQLFKEDLDILNIPKTSFIPNTNFLVGSVANNFKSKDNKFRIEWNDNSIVFNIIGQYDGWESYFGFVSHIISKLYENNIIQEVVRIGLRYISQFDNISIYKNINANICLNFIEGDYTGQTRFELFKDGFVILLTIANRQINSQITEKHTFSIIDIDVIKVYSTAETDCNSLLESINKSHEIEKELFFNLLKREFLNSLNPTY